MPGYKLCSADQKSIGQKYLCNCCGFLLKDAMQTGCGHFYCKECLGSLYMWVVYVSALRVLSLSKFPLHKNIFYFVCIIVGMCINCRFMDKNLLKRHIKKLLSWSFYYYWPDLNPLFSKVISNLSLNHANEQCWD